MSGFNTPALLFGLILLVASIGLFLFGRLKPELQRDSDNVYAIIGVVCSLILFASAFDLSLGMSFQQLLMIGSLIALMWENIQSRQPRAMAPRRGGGAFDNFRRGAGPEPGRRNGPMDNRSQGVYRYEAELDNYDRFDAPPRRDQRRIQGSEPQGYGNRYDERSRPPERDRPGRNDFDERPGRRLGPDRGPERGSDRGPERGPRRNDWDDDFSAGQRSPRDGFGPERGPGRGRGPNNARPPRDDRSMEGRPIGDGGGGGGRPPEPSGSGRLTGEGRPFVDDRPPIDMPPVDMPPRRRPRPEGPADRPPVGGPVGGPMDRPRGDRPPRRSPGADRPIIDAAPAAAGARPLEPLSEKPMGQGRPPAGPSGRPSAPQDDGYVDFKPVAPPPDDEFDNSSQFDD